MKTQCIVVGGGSTGAMAAFSLAKRGLEVHLFDRRPRAEAGAAWQNDVEKGLFDDLEIGEPPEGVMLHEPPRFVMTTPCRSLRHIVDPHPAIGLDMPSLREWLLDAAEAAGAKLRFETEARIGRYTGTHREVHLSSGTVRASFVVDARGLDRGMGEQGRRLHPLLDVCDAHQAVHEIADDEGARAFLRENDLATEDVLSIAGVESGYSVNHISLSEAHGTVAILGGSLPLPGRRGGRRIVEDFAKEHHFVGRRISGGGALIPLRPTRSSLVEDGLARAGDSAGQVFPTTGSGVAIALRAALFASRLAASIIHQGEAITRERLWPYNLHHQRGQGRACAGYQPLRYLVASLSKQEIRTFLEAGLVGPESIEAAYRNEGFVVSPAMVMGTLPRLPALAPRLPEIGRALALSKALEALYRRYPRSAAGLPRWSGMESGLMRRAADVARSRLSLED